MQLGARSIALAGLLKHRLGVSFAHIAGLLREAFGLPVTRSALLKADARLAQRLATPFGEILDHVRRAAVLHADETGWPHDGRNAWLWVFATADAALVRIRRSRGHDVPASVLGIDPAGPADGDTDDVEERVADDTGEADDDIDDDIDEGDLGAVGSGDASTAAANDTPGGAGRTGFAGTLVTDGWAAYDALGLDPSQRQQCLAHLINRASKLEESQRGPAKAFPRAVLEVLRDALATKTWQPHLPADEYAAHCEWVEAKLDRVLSSRIRDPSNARLLRFLRKHRGSLLTFLPLAEMPGTNNEAERAVRPMILPRKTCGGTRSEAGLRTHEAASSVIETCKRLARPVLDFLGSCYRGLKPALGLR